MISTLNDSSPVCSFYLFGKLEVHLFGRKSGTTEWGLSNLKSTEDETYAKINAAAGRYVKTLYAPRPSAFNAQICKYSQLKPLSGNTAQQRGSGQVCESSVVIMRGIDADGVVLPKGGGSAFWLSSGDCPTIVALSPTGDLICAHAGGKSLFDQQMALTGRESRWNESVIGAIAGHFMHKMEFSRFFITCGICGKHFKHPWDHPFEGDSNRKITEYLIRQYGASCIIGSKRDGCWSLHDIIVKQLEEHRVTPSQIHTDGICTYHDTDLCGEPIWWSHERAKDRQDGTEMCRNGVLVCRIN